MKLPLDRDALSQLLPHRGPILQLDRVTDMEPGTSIRAEKTVRHDEWWCDCHFPGNPVMPGVLIAEALAQAAGVVYASGHPEGGHDMYLAGMDKMRFRRVVRPGDELVLEVRLLQHRRQLYWFEVRATVGTDIAVDGKMMAAIVQREESE